MLLDTDVLIWFLRGNARATALIENNEGLALSVVSYMELMQGARSRAEALRIRRTLQMLEFRTLDLSASIGTLAAYYVESFGLGSRIRLADALIAATAAEHNLLLVTGNVRHFSVLPRLEVSGFEP
jgi:predicted nucleic acid-binding protein